MKAKKDTILEMRETLEGLPSPFCTKEISDSIIQEIIDNVGAYPIPKSFGDPEIDYAYERKCERWWEDLEYEARAHNIPYYEDLEDDV